MWWYRNILLFIIQISIIRLIRKYILIVNQIKDKNVNTIHYKLGQIQTSLTGTNPIVTFFCGQRIQFLFLTWPYYGCVWQRFFNSSRSQFMHDESPEITLREAGCYRRSWKIKLWPAPTFDWTPMPLGQHVLSSTSLAHALEVEDEVLHHPASRAGATVRLASRPLEVAERRERRGGGWKLAGRRGRQGCCGGAAMRSEPERRATASLEGLGDSRMLAEEEERFVRMVVWRR
jgi:hypothetical protein